MISFPLKLFDLETDANLSRIIGSNQNPDGSKSSFLCVQFSQTLKLKTTAEYNETMVDHRTTTGTGVAQRRWGSPLKDFDDAGINTQAALVTSVVKSLFRTGHIWAVFESQPHPQALPSEFGVHPPQTLMIHSGATRLTQLGNSFSSRVV